MTLVVSGMPNKQTGRQLGVTEKTVKFHRGNVMQKMEADSLAELVRIAGKIGIGPGTRASDFLRAAGITPVSFKTRRR